jgi:hypothetical protein
MFRGEGNLHALATLSSAALHVSLPQPGKHSEMLRGALARRPGGSLWELLSSDYKAELPVARKQLSMGSPCSPAFIFAGESSRSLAFLQADFGCAAVRSKKARRQSIRPAATRQ